MMNKVVACGTEHGMINTNGSTTEVFIAGGGDCIFA